jgi:ATP phosphoribosyltransferase
MPPVTLPADRLRLAIQKSGRLSTDSLDLLKSCGIRVKAPKEKLLLHAENFPVDILFVRDDDIPQLVMDGVCDLGIVGQNVLEESGLERRSAGSRHAYLVERVLDFGGCRLAIAIPEERPFKGIQDLQGLRIATSYPHLTGRYLAEQKITAEVVTLSGSVEIAPRLGLADAICDLVSSGSTLEANKLRAVETIFKSTAVLLRNAREFPAQPHRRRAKGGRRQVHHAPRAEGRAGGNQKASARLGKSHHPPARRRRFQGRPPRRLPGGRLLGNHGVAQASRRQQHPGPPD